MKLPAAPSSLSLEVSNLTVHVNGTEQLSEVSFSVPAGGALSIVGPVGSGKSALMWSINGLLDEVPGARKEGEILVSGVNTQRLPTSTLRQRVGLVIPAPLARTPLGEIAVPLRGRPASEVGDAAERVLRLVGLWHEMRDRLRQAYSVHNPVTLRLLALARTMALSPGILLLDDPTRGLDSMGRARFEAAVASATSVNDTTLIWATREPDQAGRVASHMAFLCCGQIVEAGPADSLFERPDDPRTESFLTGDYKRLLTLIENSKSQGALGGKDK